MDLVGLSVQQHGAAVSAAIVHGVGAGDQDRRRGQNVAVHGQINDAQIFSLALTHGTNGKRQCS